MAYKYKSKDGRMFKNLDIAVDSYCKTRSESCIDCRLIHQKTRRYAGYPLCMDIGKNEQTDHLIAIILELEEVEA